MGTQREMEYKTQHSGTAQLPQGRVLIRPRRKGSWMEEVMDQGQKATTERSGKLAVTERDKGIIQNPQLSEGETPRAEIRKMA